MATAERPAAAVSVLSQAEELVSQGQALAAIDLLHEANQRAEDDEVERRLAALRRAAFDHLPAGTRHDVWPVPVPVPDIEGPAPAGIPELAPSELSGSSVRRAIAEHGCVRVPGLLSEDRVAAFVRDIDQVLATRESNRDSPYRVTSSWFAGLPLPPDEAASLGRGWIAGAGGVLACDSPKVLDRLLATYAEIGLRATLTEYLGERPVLSANKCTLRLVPPDSKADWHQDGAFLGTGIRALNVWIALSDCGVDAPGMDLVPKRFEQLCPTGTGGALFDWAVGPAVVAEAAVGAPVVRPAFRAGDCLLFDELFLHRTATEPTMTRSRYAIESWFFAATGYPEGQVPLVW